MKLFQRTSYDWGAGKTCFITDDVPLPSGHHTAYCILDAEPSIDLEFRARQLIEQYVQTYRPEYRV